MIFDVGQGVGSPFIDAELLSWPELVGREGTYAVQYIKEKTGEIDTWFKRRSDRIDCLGLTNVLLLPEDALITMDYRTDRVRVFIDKDGIVVRTPRIG